MRVIPLHAGRRLKVPQGYVGFPDIDDLSLREHGHPPLLLVQERGDDMARHIVGWAGRTPGRRVVLGAQDQEERRLVGIRRRSAAEYGVESGGCVTARARGSRRIVWRRPVIEVLRLLPIARGAPNARRRRALRARRHGNEAGRRGTRNLAEYGAADER